MSVFAASHRRLFVFHTMARSSRSRTAALLLPLALVLSACGGSSADEEDAGSSPAAEDQAFPVTVLGTNGDVTIEEQPEAIVSLSATATEMLFAVGAGPQVEAVDSTSNWPTDAPITDLSAFTPNAEAIAAYEPDLVVLSDDMNGIVEALGALQIPTLQLGAAVTLDESYGQVLTVGEATGHADDAEKVVTDMRDRIDAAVEAVGDSAEGMTVYHELDPTYFSVDSTTFIGSVYELFGLENIADAKGDAANGYPALSAEYIVEQAPDLIVLADTVCCEQTAETVAQRPGFDTIPAVQEGRVVEASDDIASRWGPRVAEFAELVADSLQD